MDTTTFFPSAEIFGVECPNINIGNYKYGNLKRISESGAAGNSQSAKFTISLIESSISTFPRLKDPMFFYGIEGNQDLSHIISRREFPFGRPGFIEFKNIETQNPTMLFNKLFRYYSLTKFSKFGTIGENLADLTTLKLLDQGLLSFHGGCVGSNGSGAIITGLPDMGKTFTTMRLLKENSSLNFLAEDILITDSKNTVFSVPFTQTVEKRRALSFHEKFSAYIYNSLIRHNYIKSDVLEAMPELSGRISNKTQVDRIYFLKRGTKGKIKVNNKALIADEFIRLNNLEFNYSRNESLLTALYFNRGKTMVDYLNLERDLIRELVENVDVFEVYAPSAPDYIRYISDDF